jgi:hypothetical protein
MTDTRKSTNWIAIHCSATRPAMDVGVKEIRRNNEKHGISCFYNLPWIKRIFVDGELFRHIGLHLRELQLTRRRQHDANII